MRKLLSACHQLLARGTYCGETQPASPAAGSTFTGLGGFASSLRKPRSARRRDMGHSILEATSSSLDT
eukprot:3655505-Pyramimonas_sp.AAC.1